MMDLQQKGFKIIDAVNIIKKPQKDDEQGNRVISRKGLPLFMITSTAKRRQSVFTTYDQLLT